MANVDAPRGGTPIKHRNGAPYNGAANPYIALSTYDTAIFVGDFVVKVAGGSNTAKVSAVGAGDFRIGTLPVIERATPGDTPGTGTAITGVVTAVAADPDDLSTQYRKASTERVIWVCDDPDVIFELQADGAIPAASIGLNAVLIDTHSGSATTGRSGTELDTTSDVPAADATNQLTIQRAVNREDVDTTLTHAIVEVKINQSTEANNVVGI